VTAWDNEREIDVDIQPQNKQSYYSVIMKTKGLLMETRKSAQQATLDSFFRKRLKLAPSTSQASQWL
jgi:hypothetical protein